MANQDYGGKYEDQQQRKPESLGRRAIYWLAAWGASLAIWELLVDKLAFNELWFGVVAAIFGASATEAVRGLNFARFWPQFRWVAEGWRLPAYAVTGTAEIFTALAKQVFARKPAESLVLAARYDVGGDDSHDAARRALAIGFNSAVPNSVVIGIDQERELLVFHQISRTPVKQMTKNLGVR